MSKSRDKVIGDLKRLSEPATSDLDAIAFAQNVKGESDRGAIMLAVTMIDDALSERLAKYFSSANSDDRSSLFGFEGAAGTFSRRILLAKSTGIIDGPTRNLIDLLRHMRNACAHAQNNLNFDSPAIRAAFEHMSVDSSPPVSAMPRAQCRDLFVIMCAAIAGQIRMGELTPQTFELILPFFKEIADGAFESWLKPPEGRK